MVLNMVQTKVHKGEQKNERKVERRGFKFSLRTIENLEYLVKTGVVRNETEAIDFALEALASEYKTREKIKHEKEIVIYEGKGQHHKVKDVENCTLEQDAPNA